MQRRSAAGSGAGPSSSSSSSSTRREPRMYSTSQVANAAPLRRMFLLLVLSCVVWITLIHFNLPPFKWIDDYKHRHDKVVRHRPGFKNVERYSPEHRYRPAASPIIRKVGADGKIYKHGEYHPPAEH